MVEDEYDYIQNSLNTEYLKGNISIEQLNESLEALNNELLDEDLYEYGFDDDFEDFFP